MGGSSSTGVTSTGGTSKTSGTGTTTAQLSPEQQQALGLAMPWMQKFGTQGVNLPDFSMTAQFDPAQIEGQNQALAASGAQQPIVGSAAKGSEFLTSGAALDPSSNPALAAYIKSALDPMQQNFTESTLPAIREAGVGVGQPGSTREGIAEGLAAKGEALAEGGVAANIANQGYQSGLGAMVNALTSSPAVAGEQTMPAATTEAVGAQRQAMNQQNINEQVLRTMFPQMEPAEIASILGAFAAGIPGGGTTTTGTAETTGQGISTTEGKSNASLASMLTGGASAAGGLATGLSDLLPLLFPI